MPLYKLATPLAGLTSCSMGGPRQAQQAPFHERPGNEAV